MSIKPDEKDVRIKRLKELKAAGIDPYPASFKLSHKLSEAINLKVGKTGVSLGGRVVGKRSMGKITFLHLQDGSGRMQVAVRVGEADAKSVSLLKKYIDLGDFIGVTGKIFKTKRGEITLDSKKVTLLSKALRPLPEKFHGLKDQELRYRKRYLDLVSSEETRELFRRRSLFIKNLRAAMDESDFLEVETPVLEHVPGGAEAKPFVTHHNTLDIDLYLRISLELHLKRLLVGGIDRVYEIGKVFRNEGMSTEHLQEFTMFEFYQANADYEDLMKFTEKMVSSVIKKTFGTLKFEIDGQSINFKAPWPRVEYSKIFKKATGLDLAKVTEVQLRAYAKKIKVKVEKHAGAGRLIDQIYKARIRPGMIGPIFLINHPVLISPLAKKIPGQDDFTQRFHMILNGSEIINAYSELNDPIDQRERFDAQAKLRKAGDLEAMPPDEDFVIALEHGMPPTAGWGMGLDRLFMMLSGQDSVRDVVLFPTMKPE
ncbi:lysine--tRNA ligase [bacterium]|nr:lysine--tRNA ligase [bacterium]